MAFVKSSFKASLLILFSLLKLMERDFFASNPLLKSPFGSSINAPLKKFSPTWVLNAPGLQIIFPLYENTGLFHFHSSSISGCISCISFLISVIKSPRQSLVLSFYLAVFSFVVIIAIFLFIEQLFDLSCLDFGFYNLRLLC